MLLVSLHSKTFSLFITVFNCYIHLPKIHLFFHSESFLVFLLYRKNSIFSKHIFFPTDKKIFSLLHFLYFCFWAYHKNIRILNAWCPYVSFFSRIHFSCVFIASTICIVIVGIIFAVTDILLWFYLVRNNCLWFCCQVLGFVAWHRKIASIYHGKSHEESKAICQTNVPSLASSSLSSEAAPGRVSSWLLPFRFILLGDLMRIEPLVRKTFLLQIGLGRMT